MEHKYIDIHTHSTNKINNTISVINIIINEKRLPDLNNNCFYSAGIHPWYIDNPEKQFDLLAEIISNKNIIAIGECGIDRIKGALNDLQMRVFEFQISLSIKVEKPLIIHSVKSSDIILQLNKKYKNTTPWILHGFKGNQNIANQLIKKNILLSFNPGIMFEKEAKIAYLEEIPVESFFLETDTYESNQLPALYSFIAKKRNITVEELLGQQKHNFEQVFNVGIK